MIITNYLPLLILFEKTLNIPLFFNKIPDLPTLSLKVQKYPNHHRDTTYRSPPHILLPSHIIIQSTHLFILSLCNKYRSTSPAVDAVYNSIKDLKTACREYAVTPFFEFKTVKLYTRRYILECKGSDCRSMHIAKRTAMLYSTLLSAIILNL